MWWLAFRVLLLQDLPHSGFSPPAFTSSGKTLQLSSKLKRSRRAASIFPLKTNFVKARVSLSPVDVVLDGVGRCCCIVWPSWMRTSILPHFHASIRRCKQMRCSLAFELPCGFCNSSMGIVIAARMAKDSSADFSAYALNSLACSRMNSLPAEPEGTETTLRR